jgi:hypothetical protein
MQVLKSKDWALDEPRIRPYASVVKSYSAPNILYGLITQVVIFVFSSLVVGGIEKYILDE